MLTGFPVVYSAQSCLWKLPAAGHVISESGIAGYGSRLGKGDTAGALFGPGLLNPETADIHLVIRTHGPAEGGMTNDEIHSEYATRLASIFSSQFSSRSFRSPDFRGSNWGRPPPPVAFLELDRAASIEGSSAVARCLFHVESHKYLCSGNSPPPLAVSDSNARACQRGASDGEPTNMGRTEDLLGFVQGSY